MEKDTINYKATADRSATLINIVGRGCVQRKWLHKKAQCIVLLEYLRLDSRHRGSEIVSWLNRFKLATCEGP